MLMRDQGGAAASEYALIVSIVGGGLVLASMFLGVSIRGQSMIQAVGTNGTVYQCTRYCQEEYKDYCAAISHMNDANPPVFSPALPSGAACRDGVPIS